MCLALSEVFKIKGLNCLPLVSGEKIKRLELSITGNKSFWIALTYEKEAYNINLSCGLFVIC